MACQVDGENPGQFNEIMTNVDCLYSKCFPSKDGNIRGFYTWLAAGARYDGHMARFRLDRRPEIMINWNRLSSRQVVFVIGKFEFCDLN